MRTQNVDRSVQRCGRQKTARIDLGLALLQRHCLPGIALSRADIAAWAGCTQQLISQIETAALAKLFRALSPGFSDELNAFPAHEISTDEN